MEHTDLKRITFTAREEPLLQVKINNVSLYLRMSMLLGLCDVGCWSIEECPVSQADGGRNLTRCVPKL